MGVDGLMEYIRKHPERDQIAPRINLAKQAKKISGKVEQTKQARESSGEVEQTKQARESSGEVEQTKQARESSGEVEQTKQARESSGEDGALLLCDYAAVVRVLEGAILKSRQPNLCGYYGCDTRLLAKQVELFIRFLRSIGVEPVFYADGPTDDKDCKFKEKKRRQVEKSNRIREWEENVKAKGRKKPKDNMPHPLCYPVCDRVLKELKVECLVANCEADVVLINHCKSRRNALGILSTDTDIAIAVGCRFLPLDFFDFEDVIGFQKGDIKLRDGIRSLPCRYTSREILSKRLGVRCDDMPWIAMLCGNDYTRPYIKDVRQKLHIRFPAGVKEVAGWFHYKCSKSPESEIKKIEEIGFQKACEFSMRLYSGKLEYAKPVNMSTQMLSPVFQSIKKGTYWQQPVADAPSLGLPLPYKVSEPIRSTVYALFACRTVQEYGYHPSKPGGSSHDIPCITVQGHKKLSETREKLQEYDFSVKAVALHQFVNTPLYELGFNEDCMRELLQSAPTRKDFPPDQEVLRGIIAVSTLAHLASIKEMKWRDNEVQACLLALAATSAGVQGNVDIGQPDPDGPFLRAVSLSATISATLLSLYYVVELLDLADDAPKVSDVFCSSVFVPAYMAAMQAQDIPALAFMARALDSPHTRELMKCIDTMKSTHGEPELTACSTLITTVCSYSKLVKELRSYVAERTAIHGQ